MKNLDQYILESLKGYKPSTLKSKEQLPKDCTRYFVNQILDVDDIENLDTSMVDDMYYMFGGSKFSSDSLDLSGWDVSNVTNMMGLFSDADQKIDNNLEYIDLSNWDTHKLKYINNMFACDTNLKMVDLSGWDTSDIRSTVNMFKGCFNLTNIIFGPGWGTWDFDSVGFSICDCGRDKGYRLSDETWESMLTMYDRKVAGLGTAPIMLHNNHNIPDGWKKKMSDKGYIVYDN